MHNKDAVALAWYLQSQLTDKTDQSFLDKYTKNRGTTFVVDLSEPVPIEIVYQPVVVDNDILHLYPDVYGKVRDWYGRIVDALTAKGIDTAELKQQRVDQLRRELKKGKVEMTLQDLFKEPEAPQILSQVDFNTTPR